MAKQRRRWAKKGLGSSYLPPYSPELNRIGQLSYADLARRMNTG